MINIDKNKEEIIRLLNLVDRTGMQNLIEFLESGSDYFMAPASTMFHLPYPGGLAMHSLNVYKILQAKCKKYSKIIEIDGSSIICGLLHDLCKVNFYSLENKWFKENGSWVEKKVYVVKDQLPLGHGEKSVIMASKYIDLTDDEMLAIRWHMVAYDAGIHFNYPSGYPFKAAIKRDLVNLLFLSDYEAEKIFDVFIDKEMNKKE